MSCNQRTDYGIVSNNVFWQDCIATKLESKENLMQSSKLKVHWSECHMSTGVLGLVPLSLIFD